MTATDPDQATDPGQATDPDQATGRDQATGPDRVAGSGQAGDPDGATRRTIEAVWRIESARIIAGLARLVQDVGLAEELAQDALVVALEQWPRAGVPPNPGGWLVSTAKHRAIDLLRRRTTYQRKLRELGREIESRSEPTDPDLAAVLDDGQIDDDLLRLVFTACHPVLPTEGRVALTLRLLGGLRTDEIARAFLVPESTVGQRITRAKRTLAAKRVPFELPARTELADRLASVFEVIYLVFNEGYSATTGDDWMRPTLCAEALRLGRILARLMPQQAEVHGLLALMEIQASRIRARTGPSGEPILLPDQDRRLWDRLLIRRGLEALDRAEALGIGPYTLQAAIAACHARARSADQTDWVRIAALYRVLVHVSPSPIVELNRAVAVGMASGPADGLEIVDELADEPVLASYPLLPAVRGDLLGRLGRYDEARQEFERAAELTRNARERKLFLDRAAEAAAAAAGAGRHSRAGNNTTPGSIDSASGRTRVVDPTAG
ncbi:RNA polymerase sigma factor [Plantactinospora soyae]|uniref:RNA polymerase sigma factor (Sigma-70 family) n=1 Tax=Plantactinospora soyae TaxID=1544732 RepID=A0A927M0F1_9ACTN|nr:RNA polymerase sigma factor [Plantactinospora soyae]MBE1485739.1 RNA polymerase sigma factor (sigma-70 family) [Plantactinospora soyae]